MTSKSTHRLYVVDTPIGNLDDLTRRAKHVLTRVPLVIAEDTRRTNKLVMHIEADANLLSFHEHSDEGRAEKVVRKILDAGEAALVSDAGSPVVSDPGARLVRYVLNRCEDIDIVPIPGPSAVTAALAASGFPADRYRFAGYPPDNDAERAEWLRSIRSTEETVVIFVPPHDVQERVSELSEEMGDRRVAAANELTKEHESVVHATCSRLGEELDSMNLKGEWTFVLEPLEEVVEDEEDAVHISDDELDVVLETGVKISSGARMLAKLRGIPRGEAYEKLQQRKSERERDE